KGPQGQPAPDSGVEGLEGLRRPGRDRPVEPRHRRPVEGYARDQRLAAKMLPGAREEPLGLAVDAQEPQLPVEDAKPFGEILDDLRRAAGQDRGTVARR